MTSAVRGDDCLVKDTYKTTLDHAIDCPKVCNESSPLGVTTREIPGRGVATFAATSYAPGDTIFRETALFASAVAAQGKGNLELWEVLKREERERRLPPFEPGVHIGALVALRDLGTKRCRADLLTKCCGDDGAFDVQEEKRQAKILRSIISEGLLSQSCVGFTPNEYARLRQVVTLNGFRFNEGLDENHPHYDIGEALFHQVSRINHSCDPNAAFELSWSHEENNVVNCIRAQKAIEKGEEICISYVPIGSQLSVTERRRQLNKHWGFDCDCSRCLAEGCLNPMASPVSTISAGKTEGDGSCDTGCSISPSPRLHSPRSDGSSEGIGVCWDDLRDPDLDD